MAHAGRFKIAHGDLFPHGAYLVSEVEPVRDFDKSSPGVLVQATDKDTGLPVWAAVALDADPEARKDQKTVTVAAPHQPIPPEAPPGMPFRPVEFEGLTVAPYVEDKGPNRRSRVAYSYWPTSWPAKTPPGGGASRAASRPRSGRPATPANAPPP
jgi:hypothetical protein